MPEIRYITKNFGPAALMKIGRARAICEEFEQMGLKVTLRQLYYQHVTRGYIANKQTEYDNLGALLNDARLAGLLDWDHMIDRTRSLDIVPSWRDPQDVLSIVSRQYKRDLWADQPLHIEVWIEKEALVGAIEAVCNEQRVGLYACRGYSSQSETWAAGQRFIRQAKRGKDLMILYLGDHDPSGIDMTRDVSDRMNMFVQRQIGSSVLVERLALNMDQIELYDPPPNPAKMSDGRARKYVAEYGEESWELDALNPPILQALVNEAIDQERDNALWDAAAEQEETERRQLENLSENWDDVTAWLE